ncbi:MarR family winged helix-turn-helix transcriptional regulator [Solicola gregarius]|uniref:MarR family transcriptional regulator n=1 Tax=Solicola gregarius TaxID=2908642 RepID=A0AA46YJP4_9ACTN|nr:MarR family transcriptional regulator [Solicola gregarius]UYM03809.1 MarR family transcriptional regulator [Solicola gregarius]
MDDDAVARIVDQWRAERPDLDPDPMLVIGRIGRLAETIDGLLRPPFAAAQLGNGDFDVLAALRRAGSPYTLTPGELSRAMLVTTGAVTKRIDRLERRALVERAVAAGDARGRLVTLTPRGVQLVDDLIADHLDRERELLAGLSDAQCARLADLLGRLSAALESP